MFQVLQLNALPFYSLTQRYLLDTENGINLGYKGCLDQNIIHNFYPMNRICDNKQQFPLQFFSTQLELPYTPIIEYANLFSYIVQCATSTREPKIANNQIYCVIEL